MLKAPPSGENMKTQYTHTILINLNKGRLSVWAWWTCSTYLRFLLILARVRQNAKVPRFTCCIVGILWECKVEILGYNIRQTVYDIALEF